MLEVLSSNTLEVIVLYYAEVLSLLSSLTIQPAKLHFFSDICKPSPFLVIFFLFFNSLSPFT